MPSARSPPGAWRIALPSGTASPTSSCDCASAQGDGAIGKAMDCRYCFSVWVAAPLALVVAPRRRDRALTWLALSGAACRLERVTQPRALQDLHTTTTEARDELLWPQAARA